jgi:gas vesicle protein
MRRHLISKELDMERDQNTGRFRRTESQSRPWAQQKQSRDCTTTGGVASALGILAGAGIGAAAMYLLDPDKGQPRRERLASAAEAALESTTDAVSSAWDTVSEKAVDTGASLAASLPSRRDLRKRGHRLIDGASGAFASSRDAAGGWLDSAKGYLPNRPALHTRHSRYDVSPTQAGIGALGALALGVGAMWLLDPSRGRGRRAWIAQKTTRILNEAGGMARATGRHLRNKTKGYYHETRSLVSSAANVGDLGIAERVRSALGRVGLGGSSIAVACQDGCITLAGRCITDDIDRVLSTTRDVPGVLLVVNEMEVGTRFPSDTANTPSTF